MGKQMKKLLAIVLTIGMIATLFSVVPMTASAEDETFDTFDELTLSDLGYNPGNFSVEIANHAENGKNYTATSQSHSFALKFKWRATNNLPAKDATLFNLSFDTSYNYGKIGVWARADKFFFCYQLDDLASAQRNLTPITSGEHEVEFGRKLVLSGEHKDTYYVYCILDGNLVAGNYTNYYLQAGYNDGKGMKDTTYIGGAQLADQRFADFDWNTYDTYDELTLTDLGLNPGNFENVISSDSHAYTATTTSHSVAVKFRWKPGAMTDKGWFVCLDKDYNQAVGAWFRSDGIYFCSNGGDHSKKLSAITDGTHDIEFGRKLVTGGPKTGLYYVYLIVDGEMLAGGYTDSYTAAGYTMTNTVCLTGGELVGQRFADCVWLEEETYEDYDVIEYYDLLRNGRSLGDEDNPKDATYTYDKTSSTYSAILKFRWKAITGTKAWFSFDTCKNSINYKFGMQFFVPSDGHDNGQVDLLIDGKNKIDLPFALVSGGNYDIEFARLKVKTGHNKGRYYIYLKINDTFIGSYYTDRGFVDTNGNYIDQGENCSLSNKIYVSYWGDTDVNGNRITAIPVPETLATDYDEIGVEDLDIGGKQAVRQYFNGTATYDQLSATKSVIFKYRWENRSNPNGWISFDRANGDICDLFGVQYNVTNKTVNIGIGYSGGEGTLPANIECGTADVPTTYNVEFARIKVLTGPHKGKYCVTYKIDGELIAQDYVAVNADGTYTSNGVSCALSNEIFFSCWGGTTKDTICEIHDETPAAAVRENEQKATKTSYGTYDEVVYCSVCGAEISRTTVIDTNKLPLDMIIGTQTNKENETRLIMKLTDKEDIIRSYEKVGFIVIVDGVKQSVELDGVYTGFYNIEEGGEVKEYTAADLGCTYVSILGIGTSIVGAKTVTVQGFFIDDEGKTTLGAIRTLK